MNLEAIQKAMEELRVAKEEIAKLQKNRVEAEKNVKKALDLVDSVKDKSESTSNYSDETYWENRYKESQEPKKDVYEWYVSFENISATIEEDIGKLSSGSESLILVSGCGNSALCEDFVHNGFSNVHGMDYSPSVIKNMQERSQDLKLASIKYFQADARYMPDIPNSRYDVLFDKGTLDAIASSATGSDSDSSHKAQDESLDALNYIREMWRILRIGGLFILISTMPPDILEPLALTPLLPTPSITKGTTNSRVSNWKAGCRVLPLTTQEGGAVYYYAITKLSEISQLTSYRPGQDAKVTNNNNNNGSGSSSGNNNSSSNKTKGSDASGIMAGIAALLEEAKKAKEAMEAATHQQQKAAAEVREVENKRASLEKTLQTGIRDISSDTVNTSSSTSSSQKTGYKRSPEDEEEEEFNMNRGSGSGSGNGSGGKNSLSSGEFEGDSTEKRQQEAVIQQAIEAAVRKVAPTVKVFLNQQAATALTAEGIVDVFYLLHHIKPVSANDDSGWSEDDTVNLVVTSVTTTAAARMVDTSCYKEDEQPYEEFEYTNPPRLLSAPAPLSSTDLELLEQLDALDYIHKVSKTKPAAGFEHRFYLGQVNVKLPSFGGCFHFSYVRTLTLPATAVTLYDADSTHSSGKVVQRRVVLAQSASVTPRVPLHGAHPDARGHAVSRLFDESPSVTETALSKNAKNIRRRGAGAMVNAAASTLPAFPSELTMWVEDLSHIQTLNVITALRVTGSNFGKGNNVEKCLLARTMAWVQPSPSAPHTLQLIVEADVITPVEESGSGGGNEGSARVRTVYGVLKLTDKLFQRASVDLRAAYGHLDADGRFVCRLPCVLHSVKTSAARDKNTTRSATTIGFDTLQPFTDMAAALSKLNEAEEVVGSNNNKDVSISAQCVFCRNEVFTSECIQAMKPLPTGLLDNMMHDFICCEVLPENGLTSTDVETPQHTLLYGPLYASVHPAHLSVDAVQLQCKTHSTALDVFTGCGGALATAPIPLAPKGPKGSAASSSRVKAEAVLSEEQRQGKILQAFKTVINIDTCSILCARCTNYLGDAHLQGESCERNCAVHTTTNTVYTSDPSVSEDVNNNNNTTAGQAFAVSDLRDVRFALHAVTFSVAAARAHNIYTLTEQFVARCVLHINTTYNLSSFCLYAADADFGHSKLETVGVILKLVSPDYRISQPSPSTTSPAVETDALTVSLIDCIKVSFSVGPVMDVLVGNEARLPLEYADLRQVISLLQSRSGIMGPSPFKGQSLSYLRK